MFKIFLIMFFSFYSVICFSGPREFSIGISGVKEELKYYKVQSEIKTVKTKKFCKGNFFALRFSNWFCQTYNDGITKCRTNFRCTKPNRSISRKSLLRSLEKKVKILPFTLENFNIHVYKDLETRALPIGSTRKKKAQKKRKINIKK